jgi:hypothetical protein
MQESRAIAERLTAEVQSALFHEDLPFGGKSHLSVMRSCLTSSTAELGCTRDWLRVGFRRSMAETCSDRCSPNARRMQAERSRCAARDSDRRLVSSQLRHKGPGTIRCPDMPSVCTPRIGCILVLVFSFSAVSPLVVTVPRENENHLNMETARTYLLGQGRRLEEEVPAASLPWNGVARNTMPTVESRICR